ncbi:MAG TPA: hypothetical protein VGG74_11905 [Kofleriaceae bacterium]|jgi:hypothetical protein
MTATAILFRGTVELCALEDAPTFVALMPRTDPTVARGRAPRYTFDRARIVADLVRWTPAVGAFDLIDYRAHRTAVPRVRARVAQFIEGSVIAVPVCQTCSAATQAVFSQIAATPSVGLLKFELCARCAKLNKEHGDLTSECTLLAPIVWPSDELAIALEVAFSQLATYASRLADALGFTLAELPYELRRRKLAAREDRVVGRYRAGTATKPTLERALRERRGRGGGS